MILLFYSLTMATYFFVKRKWPHYKFAIEVIFIVFAFLIATAVRLYVYNIFPLINFSFNSVAAFFASILNVIYTVLGTFQFEGLKDIVYPEGIKAWEIVFREYLYYASSIYVALMFFSVIAVKISYEIYSQFLAFFSLRFGHKEVYIFTELNDKTLQLAKSIKEKYQKRRFQYEVIFTGPSLKPFNRHDVLCMEVIKHNFLYYTNRKKVGTPLLKTLGLLSWTPFFKLSKHQIHLFAFALEEGEEYADEVRNVELVFTEIENLAKFTLRERYKRYLKRVVRFYVLTREDLHYEKYEDNKKQIITKLVNAQRPSSRYCDFLKRSLGVKFREDPKKRLEDEINYLNALFQLHPINESKLTARSFSKKRYKSLLEGGLLEKDLLTEDNAYHALFLGFGNTNKKVLEQLYIDTSLISEQMIESKYCATVIDHNLRNRIGLYSGERPFFIVLEQLNENNNFYQKDIRVVCQNPNSPIFQEYEQIKQKIIMKNYNNQTIKQITFPLIIFKEENCTSMKFLELLDYYTGRTKAGSLHVYNTIVIALGSDEENIKLANVIINDARLELINATEVGEKPQLIAVHIKDKNNYFKLEKLLEEKNKEKLTGLKVISFGQLDELYSYENIIDDDFAKIINHAYNFISNLIYETINKKTFPSNEFSVLLEQILDKKEKSRDFAVLVSYFYQLILNYKIGEFSWLKLPEFKKESNRQTLLYEHVMKVLERKTKHRDIKKLEYLSANEHTRWNRLHFANGWRYSFEREDSLKAHDCLTDTNLIPNYQSLYDIVNVILLLKLDEIRKERGQ